MEEKGNSTRTRSLASINMMSMLVLTQIRATRSCVLCVQCVGVCCVLIYSFTNAYGSNGRWFVLLCGLAGNTQTYKNRSTNAKANRHRFSCRYFRMVTTCHRARELWSCGEISSCTGRWLNFIKFRNLVHLNIGFCGRQRHCAHAFAVQIYNIECVALWCK